MAEQQEERESLKPVAGANRALRRRLGLPQELMLALLPMLTILLVLALMERLSNQRLLFASLASSAFLIYLDPQHGTNSVRTLVFSQTLAALIGALVSLVLGLGYPAAGCAMVLTSVLMIVLDVVHPPAVATALSFAFRSSNESNIMLFGMAVGITASLVVLERFTLWLLARFAA